MAKIFILAVIVAFFSGLVIINVSAIPTPTGKSIIGDDVDVLDHYPGMGPDSADDYYKLGILYLARNMPQEADRQFHEALKLAPKHLDSMVGLVATSLRLGDLHGAADFSKKAIEIQPDSTSLRNLVGERWMANASFVETARAHAEAEAMFREALLLDPKSVSAHTNLARLYIFMKKVGDAIEEYKAAIKIEPDNPELRWGLAYLYLNTGSVDKGLVEAQEMVRLSPQNPVYRNGLGEIYINKGQPEQALVEFRQALVLDPKHAPAYTNIGKVHLAQGLLDKAMEEFNKALSHDPNYGEAHSGLGDSYFLKGDSEKAAEQYEKAIGRDAIRTLSMRASISVHNNLAYIYSEKHGDLDKALPYAQKARQLSPKHPAVADTLGWIYYKKGNYDEAIANLKVAAEAAPDHQTIRYHLGAAYYRKGLRDQAKTELSRSLKMGDRFEGTEDAKRLLKELGAR